MSYKTYEQMTEAERKAIIGMVITLAGLPDGNMASHPRDWIPVKAVELTPQQFHVEVRRPRQGDEYWSGNERKWVLATMDKAFDAVVKLPVRGRDLTDADLGRRVRFVTVAGDTIVGTVYKTTGQGREASDYSARPDRSGVGYWIPKDAEVMFV